VEANLREGKNVEKQDTMNVAY